MLRKNLPKTLLREVSRDDVKRVMDWLKDDEVSESWYGRYSYGDPAHLGYDPQNMIDASEEEWERTFNDPNHEPHRTILSITKSDEEHVGEIQLSIDEALGDAQLSILIGRKDLWHKGYGSSVLLMIMEYVFEKLKLYRIWVDIPEYNQAARTLFDHAGFKHEGTLRKSRPHEGARFNSVIMGILSQEFNSIYESGISKYFN
ncbi:MAG TPA: GNAT family protein [Dehalococcoidia bacterium]|jgi:RimJ/RimL family protein N-acetyltransferase|nr:GNAT family protein [Dehalococcoidia bacterium]